ncbi:MAG: ATP-binding domain-containing protein, partial [Terracidiphilus sp.]
AMAAFPDAKRLYLSQSFRFGPVVAEVANAVLSHLEQPTALKLRGFGKIPSRLSVIDKPDAVLCRTNSAAVGIVLQAIADGKKPHLIGGGSDVLAFVRAAQDLQRGKHTEHPELSCFESWGEVQAYVKLEEGADLKLMTNLIDKFGADKIAAALRSMPAEKDADLVVCTAHKSKGREWHKVKLASDFMPLDKMGDEELRLLYVAATRAQHVLDVESCPPFCGSNRERRCEDDDQMTDDDREAKREGWVAKIDLTEARRLSKEISSEFYVPTADGPTRVQQGRMESEQPSPQNIAKHRDDGNSWTKSKEGKWRVRGKPGQSGVVTVRRRDGKESQEKLGAVVWQDSEFALYEVLK